MRMMMKQLGAISLMIGLLGCSDDTNNTKLDKGTPKDGAAADKSTGDGSQEGSVFPDTVPWPDQAPPDTTAWPDQGPDMMNPNSQWEESTFKPSHKLMDVMGKSNKAVWAVGLKGVIAKYDGTSWKAETNPDTSTMKADLHALWTRPTDTYVYALGSQKVLYNSGSKWYNGYSKTYQYYNFRDGWAQPGGSYLYGCGEMGYYLSYKSSSSPSSSFSSIYMGSSKLKVSLYGMWGVSRSQVWAVGDSGTIFQCKASSYCNSSSYWNTQTSGTTNHLKDVYGFSASNIYAVGFGGTVLHYNGTAWKSMGPNTSTYFYGVWGTSSSDLWAVGHPYFKPTESIWHYNGTTWKSYPPPRTSYLNSVWGASSSEVWAVGNFNILKLKKAP